MRIALKAQQMRQQQNKDFKIDFNPIFQKAFDLMEGSTKNLLIMGKAGTGKSTLLTYFRKSTQKKIAVLAPTGVAAVNIEGQTIHSFFNFKPNVTLDRVKRLRKEQSNKANIYQKLDAIVIDEISMVRADLMDCVDKFLKLNGKDPHKSFGGLQMIFIGDLYQLPPVVVGAEKNIFKTHYQTPYFFSGHFFKTFEMEMIELDHVYRQKDQRFIDILNAIRNNTVTNEDLKTLNQCVDPTFVPLEKAFYIYLVPTNVHAETINKERMKTLKGKTYQFKGEITGDFEKGHLPTLLELELKSGAQVMMVNNDREGRWINGTIGKIIDIKEDEETFIVVQLERGEEVFVLPYDWELYQFTLAEGKIVSKVIGRFRQYPMKLAWAITIHKSQGKTFEKAIIDVGKNVFTAGQTYVALSRCTSLGGMVLKKPIEKKHIWSDYHIVNFVTQYQYQQSDKLCSLTQKIDLLKEAIQKEYPVEITYLKASDIKSKRQILPLKVGTMRYMNKSFEGVIAYCLNRQEERVFRIDRILEINLSVKEDTKNQMILPKQ